MFIGTEHKSSAKAGVGRIGYISREGAYSKSGLQNERGELYLNGEKRLIDKEEIKAVREDIRQSERERGRERGIILSPERKDLSKSEMLTLTKDTINHHQLQSGKHYEYVVSIHDHNGRTHAHLEAWSKTKQDLNINNKEIQGMRAFGKEREKELTEERYIDTGKNLEREPERVQTVERVQSAELQTQQAAIKERKNDHER